MLYNINILIFLLIYISQAVGNVLVNVIKLWTISANIRAMCYSASSDSNFFTFIRTCYGFSRKLFGKQCIMNDIIILQMIRLL